MNRFATPAWAGGLLLLSAAACSSGSSSPRDGSTGGQAGGDAGGGKGGGADGGQTAALPNPVYVKAASDAASADGTTDHPFPTLYAADTAILAHTDWTGALIVEAGQYQLPAEVIISPRANLQVLAGAQFLLGPQISIHLQSDAQIVGAAGNEILFSWLTEGSHWGSLTNFEPTSHDNLIEHVIFEHGGDSTFNNIEMTGTLSFNGAGGKVDHCEFRTCEGDDCFNLASSATLIESNYLHDSDGDCLDTGHPNPATQEVRFNKFEHCGNDSIDVGDGSTNLYIHDNIMIGSADKGVSIGEASAPTIKNNIMVGCNTGVAIKDSSNPIISFNTFYKNNVGLAIYEAIAGDGAGKGTFTNNIVWGSFNADIVNVGGTTAMAYNCIQSDTYQTALDVGAPTMPLSFTGLITQSSGCPDPLFAAPPTVPMHDESNGTSFDPGDLHVQSTAGRFVPAAGASVTDGTIAGSYVTTDSATSPCVDAADPAAVFALEPAPNGGRADLGAYGDSPYASKSPVSTP